MACQYLIGIEKGKIRKIKSLDCTNVDWNVWQEEVNNLVSWVTKNHPRLDGFINDMTEAGATRYLKAIESLNKVDNLKSNVSYL